MVRARRAQRSGLHQRDKQHREKERESGGKDSVSILTREEIERGDVRELAKDKALSRSLQESLLGGDVELVSIVYTKAEPHFRELARDGYGNYVLQRLLEVASSDLFDSLFGHLREEVLSLASDVHGTRVVQMLVEQCVCRKKVAELSQAVAVDAASKLALSPTGFHVIAKMIDLMPAEATEAYVEELCGTPEQAMAIGKDQWGCCVLKKCIDRSEGALHNRVVQSITDSTLSFVTDAYGNYVIQHLILSGRKPNSYVSRIVDAFRGKVLDLCLQKYSSNVLEKCLLHSSEEDQNKIMKEILNPVGYQPSEAIRMLVFHQYGNYVFQNALALEKEPYFSLLVKHSKDLIHDAAFSPASTTTNDKLPPEHMQRLALKLLKKHPELWQGFERGYYSDGYAAMESNELISDWWGGEFPPSFNYFDGYFGELQQPDYEMATVPDGAGVDTLLSQGRGQRSHKHPAAQVVETSQPYGRIVGFWPHYTVSYEELGVGVDVGGESNADVKVNDRSKDSGTTPRDRDYASDSAH